MQISADKLQLIGIRSAEVQKKPASQVIRTPGRVAADETPVYVVNAGVDGWIQETYNNSTGSIVKKGEALASFYSPDFLRAEQS